MANLKNKNIFFVIAVILIAGIIWFIQSNKPVTAPGTSIAVLPGQSVASTTAAPSAAQSPTDRSQILAHKAATYPPAVELIPGGRFINAQPFTLKSLIGKKVILVDFWTYSCINCQRSAPYVNAWYSKYKDKGLVIVGVHSPEFDFEKNYDNVVKAVRETYGIEYPVMQDNDHATWNAYQNQYWPAEYLIDIDGYITYTHFGEGRYDETEKAIQAALKERDAVLGLNDSFDTAFVTPQSLIAVDFSKVGSPETYFGSAQNDYLANGASGVPGAQKLTIPTNLEPNKLYLGGTWNFSSEYAEDTSDAATISYRYNAKNVYFVASSDKGVKIKILRDGKPLAGSEAGSDVSPDGTVFIKDNRLYDIVKGADYGKHTLEIQIEGAGLKAFTFTFG